MNAAAPQMLATLKRAKRTLAFMSLNDGSLLYALAVEIDAVIEMAEPAGAPSGEVAHEIKRIQARA